MRLPVEKIRRAIQHPEEEVRLTALSYFTGAFDGDVTIMPLVIEAVEKYGRENTFGILRGADLLSQTPLTIKWLVNELRRDFDVEDVQDDNYRFAIAILLCEADPELLLKCHQEILKLPSFPSELKGPLDERLKMHFWDWETGWSALEALGQDTMERDEMTLEDSRRAHRMIRSLSRRRDEGADQILTLLRHQYKKQVAELMDWLEPWIVELAGMLRLEQAIPYLMRRLDEGDEGDESMMDEVGPALSRIGTDAVIQAVNRRWRQADEEIRFVLCDPLEHIHTDLSAQRSLTLLNKEDDFEVALHLGHAALSNFSTEAIEPVRELVLGDEEELTPDQWDLRWKLVAACTIMGASFSEYQAWHKDALENNYGWGDHRDDRVRDAFRADRGQSEPEYDDAQRVIPMSNELKKLLEEQRQAFVQKHGREPGPDDLLFPDLPHLEHLEHMMVEGMKKAGIDPAIIHAYERTGLLVTEDNQHLISDEDMAEWNAATEEYEQTQGLQDKSDEFPLGTVAFYGPDDKVTTKIVAGVILDKDEKPILERWVGTNIKENRKVEREIHKFFKRHKVNSVAISDGNIGCPHEEGEDFPMGEDCPFCPYWKGKQGSNAAE